MYKIEGTYIFQSFAMNRCIRTVACNLCKENIQEQNALEHMKLCVERYSITMLSFEISEVLDKYYILMYILGYGGE